MAGNLFEITEDINHFLSYIISVVPILALMVYVVKFSRASIKKQGPAHGAVTSGILILEAVAPVVFLGGIPILVSWDLSHGWVIPLLGWGILLISIGLYILQRKHFKRQVFNTSMLHLAVLMLGWWINRWLGILLFSAPILAIFYITLYRLSLVTIPASTPDDQVERYQRFLVFCSYVWGLQMPLWNVSTIDAKEAEKRIDGSPSFIPFPGMIRTDTHQMVGIMNGNNLRAAGPGVVFTQKDDLPLDIVDLRNKFRKCTIHAFSKEGIPFMAVVTVIFSIDHDMWTAIQFLQLSRVNPILKNGNLINSTGGQTFPYSNARVQAALHLRSKSARPDGEFERWDDHVLAIAEKAARETLAERGINELWQARENVYSNAAGEISNDIGDLIEFPLRTNGIKLIKVKVSGFIFPDQKSREMKDEEGLQQIAAWNVEREREIRIAKADTVTRAKWIEEEARMNARSILLTAIMEGLKQANQRHRSKNHEAISQVYLNALKNMIDQHLDLSYKSETADEPGNNRDRDDE